MDANLYNRNFLKELDFTTAMLHVFFGQPAGYKGSVNAKEVVQCWS
jgi:hypothetical protein